MARINAGAQSTWRKKAGSYVYRKWRNLNVASIYQPIVKNPRTAAQIAVRDILSTLSTLGRGMSNVINIGMKKITKGTNWSPRNYFAKLNYGNVVANIGGGASITWNNIKIARGTLNSPSYGAVHTDNPNEVECQFSLNGVHADGEDYDAILAVYSDERKECVYLAKPFNANGNVTVTVGTPSNWSGLVVHVFGFIRYNGDDAPEINVYKGDVSDSTHIGNATVS